MALDHSRWPGFVAWSCLAVYPSESKLEEKSLDIGFVQMSLQFGDVMIIFLLCNFLHLPPLVEFLVDLLLCKLPRFRSQHIGKLLLRHADLVTDRYHTIS